MAILRFSFYGVLVYLYYLVAYPNWASASWGLKYLPAVFCAAVALYVLFKLMSWSPALAKIAMEALFVAGVAVYMGSAMPRKPGEPTPIQEWINGSRPTQKDAQIGLKRLGVNPGSAPGQWIAGMFPAR